MKFKSNFKVKNAFLIFMAATMIIAPFNSKVLLKPIYAENGEEVKYYDSPNYQNDVILKNVENVSYPADSGNALKNSTGVAALTPEQNVEKVPNAVSIAAGAEYVIEVNVPKAGGYNVYLDYYVPQMSLDNITMDVKINNQHQFLESKKIYLRTTWKDISDVYETDTEGNERLPDPERVFKWETAALNSQTYNLKVPYVFNFNEGKNIITIKNGEVPFYLSKITLGGKVEYQKYENYKATNVDKTAGTDNIIIEGENYDTKNQSYIMPDQSKNSDLYPQSDKLYLVNNLDEESWMHPGDKVTYNFTVADEGMYYIAVKYRAPVDKNLVEYKNIYIDGKPIYDEMMGYKFPYSSDFRNEIINVNGEAAPIYLTAGEHTISLETTADPEFVPYEQLLQIVENLNKISMDIKYITGGKSDKNRDWELETYMPNLVTDLEANAQLLQDVYDELLAVNNGNVGVISNLLIAKEKLLEASRDLNYLANNVDILAEGSNSCVTYATLVIESMIYQFVAVDRIYITGDLNNIPEAKIGFVPGVASDIKQFGYSFSEDQNVAGDVSEDKLDIWVGKSAVHIEQMKEKFEEFTEETGIPVNISAIGDEQKLLLAVAADAAPDMVIGATNYRPFDFALRGAIYDLRQFDDFETILDDFVAENFVPFIINDACYAVPDTVNFQLTFYRKDIFENLGLEVPKTWDEVIEILPELARYDMSVSTAISTAGALKHFGTTIPFIQQYGGKVYEPDGTAVAFGDPKTVEAFTLMTDLYTRYSLPPSVPNFYNSFRRGVTPLGISDLNTYYLLRDATPELTGLWGIAPSIGVKDEVTGEINIAQPSVMSCSMIMQDSDMHEESWEALKWWMSTETQTEYANGLLLRFGPEYFYQSANKNALANSNSMSDEDLEVMLYQLEHTQEVPRNPAYFNVERELSDAWNRVVFEGETPRNSLDKAIINSNREIEKKLKEFGYMDQEGNMIKPFTMASGETVTGWMEEGN